MACAVNGRQLTSLRPSLLMASEVLLRWGGVRARSLPLPSRPSALKLSLLAVSERDCLCWS